MIKSFASAETKAVFEREIPKRFRAFARQAYRKLGVLHAANDLRVLSELPGNRLEKLRGDRAGQYSIRINDRFRIFFLWNDGNEFEVEILVSHSERTVAKRLKPVHPGEILREEFMKPLGLSMNKLAMDLRVPVTRIGEIVHERRGITAATAVRLDRYFKNTPEFWMNLQTWYDLEVAKDEREEKINRDLSPLQTAHSV